MTTFREAVEARDVGALAGLLADDVVFRSPVAHRPYTGRPIVTAILRAVLEVFQDFRYVHEFHADAGADHVLVFEATVDGLQLTGVDVLTVDGDGRVTELMVMVRPLRAAEALARQMGERFEQIRAEAVAAMTAAATGTGEEGPR